MNPKSLIKEAFLITYVNSGTVIQYMHVWGVLVGNHPICSGNATTSLRVQPHPVATNAKTHTFLARYSGFSL